MGQQTLSFDDEKDLTFIGLVCFLFKPNVKFIWCLYQIFALSYVEHGL